MRCEKGIILAGGTGSRLYPMTGLTNKQLLPIFNKPAIYYPLTTLMLAGIQEILIICNPSDLNALQGFLGTGEQWNIQLHYATQRVPRGLADAFLIGEWFIDNQPACLILGDNVFHGAGFSHTLQKVSQSVSGAHLFAYAVNDPERYGVVELDGAGNPISLQEKPTHPRSNLAVTGLYFYDQRVADWAKALTPSARGELEITDLNQRYLELEAVTVHTLGRGHVWFDIGTPYALAQASQYVQIIETHQSVIIASPEEVAWRMNYISDQAFYRLVETMPTGLYSDYLQSLLTSARLSKTCTTSLAHPTEEP